VLIYFASGLRLSGVDNQAQFQATTNAAIRANVSLYSIGRARVGGAGSAGRCHPGLAGRAGDVFRPFGAGRRQQFSAVAGYVVRAGGGYGRKALLDNNDLSVGIVQAEQSIGSYYIPRLLLAPTRL